MGRKKQEMQAERLDSSNEVTVLWKATRAMNEIEHEQLSSKLRFEEAQSGAKIILVPFSVDAEIVQQEQSELENIDESDGSEENRPVTDIDQTDESKDLEE